MVRPPYVFVAAAMLLAMSLAVGVTIAGAALPPDGSVITNFGDGAGRAGEVPPLGTGISTSVAVQRDGRFVTGERTDSGTQPYLQVTRRMANGSLDPTFCSAGYAMLAIDAGDTG
ncbi:MAG: hypothetical protein ABI200_04250, partial [Gaiellales bacterium]